MSRPPFLTLPPCARARRLVTGRGEFAVLDAAPPPGSAVRGTALLVPGFTGSKEDFIALLEPLAAAGFRTVAVDGRGQFETPGPADDEGPYGFAELGADLTAQTAALAAEAPGGPGGPVHLLGHSMGGLVARAAVLAAAGAGGALPWASLTLMSTGPGAVEPGQGARLKILVDVLATMSMADVWRAMRSADPEAPPEETPAPGSQAQADFLRDRWLATSPAQLRGTGRQLLAEPDQVAELAAVAPPTLVLSGEVDYAWPVPWQDAMADRLAARRVVIAGSEHSPNVERPAETAAALVDFWTAGPPAAR
jgi:pimeloyl-ACP methyl ester carboxylesterase